MLNQQEMVLSINLAAQEALNQELATFQDQIQRTRQDLGDLEAQVGSDSLVYAMMSQAVAQAEEQAMVGMSEIEDLLLVLMQQEEDLQAQLNPEPEMVEQVADDAEIMGEMFLIERRQEDLPDPESEAIENALLDHLTEQAMMFMNQYADVPFELDMDLTVTLGDDEDDVSGCCNCSC